MTIRVYHLKELALSQLETALGLFAAGQDYASVVTLDGVADEIFGKLLAAAGKESSIELLKMAACAIHKQW